MAKKLTEAQENAIEEIIGNFNFEGVYSYMRSVGWTYFDSPDTPTRKRLEESARERLESCLLEGCEWSSCGGFLAEFSPKETPPQLTLRFILAEKSSYI